MIVKMIKNLENKMEKIQKSINKDPEELMNKHTETNNTISKIFSYPFFSSSSSGTPIVRMLVCLIWSQRSLRLSSALFILFILFCSSKVISFQLTGR